MHNLRTECTTMSSTCILTRGVWALASKQTQATREQLVAALVQVGGSHQETPTNVKNHVETPTEFQGLIEIPTDSFEGAWCWC
jgi:hypothetical protein